MSIANNRQTDDQITAKKQATVAPFDRLPPVGEKRIPGNSPYHTARAQDARNNALNYLSVEEVHSAAETLIEAGNKRYHADIADVADHNALTLAAALRYADLGLHVVDSHGIKNNGTQTFPRPDGCKSPRGARWQERATTDSETIVNFWTGDGTYAKNSEGKQWPYAKVNAPRNVSIVFPPSCGFFALDIDGKKGQAELERLEAEHGKLPGTLTSLSGSGVGFHMVFRTSETILNTAGVIAQGVDIRGAGGQIIAPPSVHPTLGFYGWKKGNGPDDGIADAPRWLVELALVASKKTNSGRRVRPDGQAASEVHTPREPTGDSSRFDILLSKIGDDANGFNSPIYAAACSWFSAHGTNADASILKDALLTSILDAFCKDDRNAQKYATDAHLDGQIEKARAFIEGADGHVDHGPSEDADDAEQPHAQGTALAVVERGPNRSEIGKQRKARDAARAEEEAADAELFEDGNGLSFDITAPLPKSPKQAVKELERRFKYVNAGGKGAFLRVADYRVENVTLEFWSKATLKEFHEDRAVKKNGKQVNPVDLLIKDAKRYSKVEFTPPPAKQVPNSHNLYCGFALPPLEGDCGKLKGFLKDVICGGDADAFKWLWLWMAHMLQRPGEKPGTSVVVHGEGGVGKGTFGELLAKLVDPYSITVDDKEQVLGTHAGASLMNAILVIAEEAFFAGDKQSSNTLKSMTTKPTVLVNPKHLPAFQVPSYIRFLIDGNDFHIVNIEGNGSERRYFVLNVPSTHKGDEDYWDQLRLEMEGPALAALAYELLNYSPADDDLSWARVRTAPATAARRAMAYQSLSPVERVLLTAFDEGGFTVQIQGGAVVQYEFGQDVTTRLGSDHLRTFLNATANKYDANQTDPLKVFDTIFKGKCQIEKGKGTVRVAYEHGGNPDPMNLNYFEVPPLAEIHAEMQRLGFRA